MITNSHCINFLVLSLLRKTNKIYIEENLLEKYIQFIPWAKVASLLSGDRLTSGVFITPLILINQLTFLLHCKNRIQL